jgi:predicted dehydrogenase
MQRRQFLSGTAASLTALSAGRVLGANDRVQVGVIGCGTRGTYDGRLIKQVPGVAIVAACDVYETNANRAAQWAGAGCKPERDFRRVLDRKDVDAVLVATPDHWHAIPTVLACQAGKDVYVEKPLAHNVREGRAMVAAARKYNRIVQTGTQHRSSTHYAEAAKIVQGGELGKVHFVRLWNYTNMYPNGIGAAADSSPPEGLDWDFYLGPAPKVPFNKNRFLGTFRWFWDYAGGFLTDFGTHRIDSMQQVMGVDAPSTVSASGHRYELKDGGETPDVLQVTYEYPGFVMSYECCTLSGQGVMGRTPGKRYYRASGPDDRPHGEAFYGTNGTLLTDRIGYEVIPELQRGRRGGGTTGARMPRKESAAEDRTDLHVKNFIECVRSRQRPAADVEIGHKATLVGHLGNIGYRTGRKLRWDAEKEQIVGDPDANALLGRDARKPWDLI